MDRPVPDALFVARGMTITRVWLLLIAASLLSFALADSATSARLAATAVILIAACKVRLVTGHFMEVNRHHRPWRLVLNLWIFATALIILGGYWVAIFNNGTHHV